MQNSKLFLPNSFIKRRRQFPMPLRFPFHGYKNVICKRAIHLRKNHHCLKCPSCRFSLFLSAKHRLNICGNILLNLHFVTVFWRCSSFHECRKRCGGRGGVGRLCDWRAGSLVKLHNGTEIFVALIRGVVDYSSEFSLRRQWCKQTRQRKIIPRGHKTRRAKNSALQELSFSSRVEILHAFTLSHILLALPWLWERYYRPRSHIYVGTRVVIWIMQ